MDNPIQGVPRTRWRLKIFLTLVAAVAGAAWLWWRAEADPKTAFLTDRRPAQWIIYPSVFNPGLHRSADWETEFRKQFTLDAPPGDAHLHVRAFRQCRVTINGRQVDLPQPSSRSWKDETLADVAAYLHVGKNDLAVVVHNTGGYPALWLAIEGNSCLIASDESWEASLLGAAWQQAQLASRPLKSVALRTCGRLTDSRCRGSWLSLLDNGPGLAAMAGASVTLVLAGRWWRRRCEARAPGEIDWFTWRQAGAAVLVVAVLWTALVWHNNHWLGPDAGFDTEGHLAYIDFIRHSGRLPLKDDGWEMFQPPLFYVTADLVLSSANLPTQSEGGLMCLRMLTLACCLGQIVLAFACLRLLFPRKAAVQLVGLVLVAFLPMNLYIFEYVTNEGMAAAVGTLAIYLCLRTILAPAMSPRWCAAVGAAMGAALLTKVSALVLVPAVLAAIVARLATLRQIRNLLLWAQTVGATLAFCLAVCGWHYFKVWQQYGSPLVGNWDGVGGLQWWQEMGYQTAAWFERFGATLVQPFFAGQSGFADEIYSTLWADGLCGGYMTVASGPAWTYGLMAAGILLSLVPSLLMAMGVLAGAVQWVRRPSAQWLLMLGVPLTVLAAVVDNALSRPFYGSGKAFYGMTGVVSLVACGALAAGWVLPRGAWLRVGLWVILLTWAMNSYASFWIDASSPVPRLAYASQVLAAGQPTEAWLRAQEVLAAEPRLEEAHMALGLIADSQGRAAEAKTELEQAKLLNPRDPDVRVYLAGVLRSLGDRDRAEEEARKAVELAPHEKGGYIILGTLQEESLRPADAVDSFRQALRTAPDDGGVHYHLATCYTALRQYGLAKRHMELAVTLPVASQPAMAVALAWFLATCPDDAVRDGPRALRVAESAIAPNGPKDWKSADARAAALAEMGRYPDAARIAAGLVRDLEQQRLVTQASTVRRHLECYQTNRPWREP
jgi:tetratricopeptide (TPR) repeat protein